MKSNSIHWLIFVVVISALGFLHQARPNERTSLPVLVDPSQDLGVWQGWGGSLAWWAHAIGGTANADFYADLIYTTRMTDSYPGLGLNIVRYNVGGGGIHQANENKGPKLKWYMDIRGYWTDHADTEPSAWNWSADQNQRTLMLRARERGANVFEMFSDSPMWWMNSNRSTAGSDSGGDCLLAANYDHFALYLATVARHSADHWGIKFDSVEPFNEPSANWWKYPNRQEGCHFDIATQQAIVQRLRRDLDRAHLEEITVSAADENNMDVGLRTWNAYDSATRDSVGRVNVHGYSNGTEPYRGPNRAALRRAVGSKRLWQSEYGDGDASGYTMAQAIIRDLKELRPSAWVYWQVVEPDAPEYGWGAINATYLDTRDQPSAEKTPFVRVNRKFFVYGQFTRYIRPTCRILGIDDPNSIAAYDPVSHRLVITKVTGDAAETLRIDLSRFASVGESVHIIATTTHPINEVPDWKQHEETLRAEKHQKLIGMNLHPKSVYTLVIEGVLR